jgi:hypothetical protein
MEDMTGAYRVLVGRPEGSDYLENQGADGKVILILIFKNCDGEAWTGLIWLRIGTGGERL